LRCLDDDDVGCVTLTVMLVVLLDDGDVGCVVLMMMMLVVLFEGDGCVLS
jgi:hypothetical protein